jgi:hypothetical protein
MVMVNGVEIVRQIIAKKKFNRPQLRSTVFVLPVLNITVLNSNRMFQCNLDLDFRSKTNSLTVSLRIILQRNRTWNVSVDFPYRVGAQRVKMHPQIRIDK